MSESKRGIKPIGKSSFLYYLTPEIIYHINIEEEKTGIKILFVKMKCDKTWIYQHIFKQDEINSIVNPLKRNNNLSNKEIINDISLLIYNNNFSFNEMFDKILVKLIFDKSNQTSFYLKLLVENNESLENKSKQELLYEIERLNNIINEINNAFEDNNIHNNMELVKRIKNILKGIDLTEKDKRQIKGLKEEFKR
jgi:hypothetical protein